MSLRYEPSSEPLHICEVVDLNSRAVWNCTIKGACAWAARAQRKGLVDDTFPEEEAKRVIAGSPLLLYYSLEPRVE